MVCEEIIQIPEGVEIKLGPLIKVNGPKGELSRTLHHLHARIEMDGNKIKISVESDRRKDKALVGAFAAHIRNMIKGVTEGFEYRMKCVYAHFPIKMSVKGKEFVIENMLGENKPRKAVIVGDTNVKIEGENVILTGINLEEISQTAANIELATRIKDRDPRRFQDGIYIVHKG